MPFDAANTAIAESRLSKLNFHPIPWKAIREHKAKFPLRVGIRWECIRFVARDSYQLGVILNGIAYPGANDQTRPPKRVVKLAQKVQDALGEPAEFEIEYIHDDPILYVFDGVKRIPLAIYFRKRTVAIASFDSSTGKQISDNFAVRLGKMKLAYYTR